MGDEHDGVQQIKLEIHSEADITHETIPKDGEAHLNIAPVKIKLEKELDENYDHKEVDSGKFYMESSNGEAQLDNMKETKPIVLDEINSLDSVDVPDWLKNEDQMKNENEIQVEQNTIEEPLQSLSLSIENTNADVSSNVKDATYCIQSNNKESGKCKVTGLEESSLSLNDCKPVDNIDQIGLKKVGKANQRKYYEIIKIRLSPKNNTQKKSTKNNISRFDFDSMKGPYTLTIDLKRLKWNGDTNQVWNVVTEKESIDDHCDTDFTQSSEEEEEDEDEDCQKKTRM